MYQHADAVCEHCGEKFVKVVVQVHMGGSWRYLHEHCDREFAAKHGFHHVHGRADATRPKKDGPRVSTKPHRNNARKIPPFRPLAGASDE